MLQWHWEKTRAFLEDFYNADLKELVVATNSTGSRLIVGLKGCPHLLKPLPAELCGTLSQAWRLRRADLSRLEKACKTIEEKHPEWQLPRLSVQYWDIANKLTHDFPCSRLGISSKSIGPEPCHAIQDTDIGGIQVDRPRNLSWARGESQEPQQPQTEFTPSSACQVTQVNPHSALNLQSCGNIHKLGHEE